MMLPITEINASGLCQGQRWNGLNGKLALAVCGTWIYYVCDYDFSMGRKYRTLKTSGLPEVITMANFRQLRHTKLPTIATH